MPTLPQSRISPALAWPLAALAILLVLQFSLIFTRAINWDEYYFFHEVADFAHGKLTKPLQTIHTRIFAWLPGMFATSTDHIVTARLAMFGCELVTLGSMFVLARRFAGPAIAVFAPLLYLGAGYVLQHGTSFRVDPMATAALTAALAVLATSKLDWRGIAGFGLLLGLAGMITIKAILFAPAFIGLGLMRLQQTGWNRAQWLRLALSVAAAVAAFGVMFVAHSQGIADPQSTSTGGGGGVGSSAVLLDSSSRWMFFIGVPPYWQMALKAAATAPVLTMLIALAPVMIWRSSRDLGEKLALTGLWAPLLSLLFYTNTAAYYYAFMLAPVTVSTLLACQWLLDRYSPRMVALVILALGASVWMLEDRAVIDRQRQLESNVAGIFADPVPYFDDNHMLGAWPKLNSFMTPWNMARYREAGYASYRATLLETPVPLLLANSQMLAEIMAGDDNQTLLAQDTAALRGNYIEFSPAIWLAGKDIVASGVQRNEEFLIPGTYTLHGGDLVVDGQRHAAGAVIAIPRGVHLVQAIGGTARLVWGDNLPVPANPIDDGPLYVLF